MPSSWIDAVFASTWQMEDLENGAVPRPKRGNMIKIILS